VRYPWPSVLFGGTRWAGRSHHHAAGRIRESFQSLPAVASRQQYRLRAAVKPALDYYVSLNQVMEDGYRDFTTARLSRAFVKIGVHAGDTDATVSYQFSNNRIEQAGSCRRACSAKTAGRTHRVISGRRAQLRHRERPPVSRRALTSRPTPSSALSTPSSSTSPHCREHAAPQSNPLGGGARADHRGKIAERDNVLIVGAEYTRSDATAGRSREQPRPAADAN